jgi:DNA-binding NarL/FixJ family response regulator
MQMGENRTFSREESKIMRILIVEDDPLMQLGLEQALSEQPDFEIVGQASDGLAGVQLALSLRPDLVVMDIGLPRLDGIAATKQIKEVLASVHVVMLTSHTLQQEVIGSSASGADAYCIKGASLDRLLPLLKQLRTGHLFRPSNCPFSHG